jgi:hypothetical protein
VHEYVRWKQASLPVPQSEDESEEDEEEEEEEEEENIAKGLLDRYRRKSNFPPTLVLWATSFKLNFRFSQRLPC